MSDTIYWAVKLDSDSVARLFSAFPPKHPNVYAEHMTIVFRPSEDQEQGLVPLCGSNIELAVIGYAEDDKGQAVVVSGQERLGGGMPHITISCADGTKPFYSNTLLGSGYDTTPNVTLQGVVARFTGKGWDTTCESLQSP